MANVFKCHRSDCEFNCEGCYCSLDEITLDEYGCCEDYTHRIGEDSFDDETEDDYPDFDDSELETGFNPYMGCYDFDC